VLKNLLSNAFKFTDNGSVTFVVMRDGARRVRFSVRDTGIGIAPENQEVIFEAFRQADGTTSRKYGGTGLGLSIARELSTMLGGYCEVESEVGKGSRFDLVLPDDLAEAQDRAGGRGDRRVNVRPDVRAADRFGGEAWPATRADAAVPAAAPRAREDRAAGPPSRREAVDGARRRSTAAFEDDRTRLTRHGRLILAIEDDTRCILLDVGLPDASGLSVLERLKRDPRTRHLPTLMFSVADNVQTALELGAVGYALKPVTRAQVKDAIKKLEDRHARLVRRVLLVEDDARQRESIEKLLAGQQAEVVMAGTVAEALAHLESSSFDCMILDLTLPDGSGYDLLEKMAVGSRYSFPPVIVYTGRELSREDEERLRRYSRSIIVKGVRSPERLLDEVTLFLHQVESALPAEQQRLLAQARQREAVFEGRRILVVEDDVRNVFALSRVLEPRGAKIEIARNGREALAALERDSDVDLVLMDLMMPEMDGLTAIREIRAQDAYKRVPIIALTAKAMPDDRDQALSAGANDYMAKPFEVDRLLSLCRVWLPR
jgi:CheY-like chemotaxis protein